MFIAGIEIFFGFVAGAILLAAGIFAIVKLPLAWSWLKRANEWIVRLPWIWRVSLLFGPIFVALCFHRETIAGVAGAVWFGVYFANRVIWELRTGSRWMKKFCVIAFGFLFFIIIGGPAVDWLNSDKQPIDFSKYETQVPVFAPDGTLGDIPASRVAEAVAAGGHRAERVQDRKGNWCYVPILPAGVKLDSCDPTAK